MNEHVAIRMHATGWIRPCPLPGAATPQCQERPYECIAARTTLGGPGCSPQGQNFVVKGCLQACPAWGSPAWSAACSTRMLCARLCRTAKLSPATGVGLTCSASER